MRRLLVGLLFCLLAGSLEAQEYAGQKTLSEKNPPDLTGTLVDYETSHGAALVLATPCASAGPPTWRTLCAETMVALGGTLSTVTPVAADSIFIIQSGELKLAAFSSFGGSVPAAATIVYNDKLAFYDTSASDAPKYTTLQDFYRQTIAGKQASVVCADEMFFQAIGTIGNCAMSGLAVNGTGAISNGTATPGHPGITQCLSTAAADRCGINGNIAATSVSFGAGQIAVMTATLKLDDVSDDALQDFTVRIGWSDDVHATVDGVLFRYNDNANSGKWLLVCRSNSSEAASTTDTGILVDAAYNTSGGPLADGFHNYAIVVTNATSAEGFIDGTSVGTCSANIPTGVGRETGQLALGLVGGTGATNDVTIQLDAYSFAYFFTTPR